MNLENPAPDQPANPPPTTKIRQAISRSKKHYQNNPEYYKEYYKKHKARWNDYTLKTCECGLQIKCMWSHLKSQKHALIMELLNRERNGKMGKMGKMGKITVYEKNPEQEHNKVGSTPTE